MKPMLWRVLFAVIAVVVFYALLPPLSHVLGFAIGGDLMTIIRICVAALAVIYIIWGSGPSWPAA
jgi:hypothetical protein